MAADLIFALGSDWRLLRDGRVQRIEALSAVEAPVRVVTDFGEAPVGVFRTEMEKRFALPVIEKRLRSEGLIDGESRLVAHRLARAGNTTLAFVTAAPLAEWQRVQLWAARQAHGVELFSLGQVLGELAGARRAIVARWGRQFHFFRADGDHYAHETVAAYSNDEDDLATAVDALAGRLERLDGGRALPDTVHWFDLFAEQPGDGQATPRLAHHLGTRLGVDCRVSMGSTFAAEGESGLPLTTVAADTVRRLPRWRALNPALERLANHTAAAAGILSLVGGVLAVSMLGWAAWDVLQARAMQARAGQLRAEAEHITARLAPLKTPEQVLAPHEPALAFLGQLDAARARADAGTFLRELRSAADVAGLHILRVQADADGNGFVVDGAVAPGADAAVGSFLSAITRAGYRAVAVDPGMRGGLQPGQFSYHLRSRDKA